MKNITSKWQINYFTYFYFFLAFLCGYFKNSCFIFITVIIHELGHILTIKLFKYQIISVTLYPFGGITKIDKPINSSINKELVIAFSGILMQLILNLFINDKLFKYYNLVIMLFNILPIIPLDGHRILNLILDKFLPYEYSLKYSNYLSIISLIIFIIYNILSPNKNYLICSFLFFMIIITLKNQKYLINKFYLERYLYSFPYHKIENNQDLNIHLLKKNTLHFFKYHKRYIHEKSLLKQIFKQ